MKRNNILVLGSAQYGSVVKDFGRITDYIDDFIAKPKKFSAVLFCGGADVHPSFYGDVCSLRPMCYSSIDRDLKEAYVYHVALRNRVKMIGICRGFQFLNVMNGGKMMHHLDNHESVYHKMECVKDNIIRTVNSYHHQMVIPGKNCKVVAWSAEKRSEFYFGNKDERVSWDGPEIEAGIFPKAMAVGVQWHPEWLKKSEDGRIFFHEMVRRMYEMPFKEFTKLYTETKEENGNGISESI
jgi:gamma-glutamyl-gamma-aminobutyrate hydrolase PuuD